MPAGGTASSCAAPIGRVTFSFAVQIGRISSPSTAPIERTAILRASQRTRHAVALFCDPACPPAALPNLDSSPAGPTGACRPDVSPLLLGMASHQPALRSLTFPLRASPRPSSRSLLSLHARLSLAPRPAHLQRSRSSPSPPTTPSRPVFARNSPLLSLCRRRTARRASSVPLTTGSALRFCRSFLSFAPPSSQPPRSLPPAPLRQRFSASTHTPRRRCGSRRGALVAQTARSCADRARSQRPFSLPLLGPPRFCAPFFFFFFSFSPTASRP